MAPTYAHAGIALWHARWEDWLPTLEPGSIDLLICDPNYGTTALDWDVPWDWPRFWAEANRVCKPHAPQVLFSAQPFTTDLITSNRGNYRYEIIWKKTMPVGFLDANNRPLRVHENIEIFCRAFGKSTYHPQMRAIVPTVDHNRAPSTNPATHYQQHRKFARLGAITERYPTDVLEFSNGNGSREGHATSKPLPLLEWLIATYSNPGDLVCDPGFGRGTAARAAKNLGRRFGGCKMRAECVDKAARWLAQEVLPFAAGAA